MAIIKQIKLNKENKTNIIKLALLNYWRFKRQFCCCTELELANYNISDVVAYDFKDTFIDCEIKISSSDLKADIKKQKHYAYKNNPDIYYRTLPNKFMYCVTKELKDQSLSQAKNINTKYGVMIFYDSGYYEIIKSPQKLYKGINGNIIQQKIIKRLNSEVITLRKKELKNFQ